MSKKWRVGIGVSLIVLIFLSLTVWQSSFVFLFRFLKSPLAVGATFSCSSVVAQETSRYLAHDTRPGRRILEVGAGDGALTHGIIQHLTEHDHLDIVEIDEEFCKILQDKFSHHKNISVHCCSITDWNPTYRYDYIVSALPFNNFDYYFLKSILQQYQSLIKKRGVLSYVELMGFAWLVPKLFTFRPDARNDYMKKLKLVCDFKKSYGIKTTRVYRNFWPIYVHHLKMTHAPQAVSFA